MNITFELLAAYDLLESERDTLKQQNAELAAQVAGLNKVNSKLSQIANQQGRINQLEAALDCLQYAAHLNSGICNNLDKTLADTLVIHNNMRDEAPAQCLLEVKAVAGRDGYQLGAERWCSHQNELQIHIEHAADEHANKIRRGE